MNFPTKYNYILVPGLGGSGEQHWQSIWRRLNGDLITLEQDHWNKPGRDKWVGRLVECVENFSNKPVILITHSMAFTLVTEAAADGGLLNVAGAFCVAPADLERADFPAKIDSFLPVSRLKLPFPSMLVASENDPYCSIEKSKKWANVVGAKFINVGKKGHLDSTSDLGSWEVGQNLLLDFISLLD